MNFALGSCGISWAYAEVIRCSVKQNRARRRMGASRRGERAGCGMGGSLSHAGDDDNNLRDFVSAYVE